MEAPHAHQQLPLPTCPLYARPVAMHPSPKMTKTKQQCKDKARTHLAQDPLLLAGPAAFSGSLCSPGIPGSPVPTRVGHKVGALMKQDRRVRTLRDESTRVMEKQGDRTVYIYLHLLCLSTPGPWRLTWGRLEVTDIYSIFSYL